MVAVTLITENEQVITIHIVLLYGSFLLCLQSVPKQSHKVFNDILQASQCHMSLNLA